MTDLTVTPEQLETLAIKQDGAAASTEQAALVTTHLRNDTELTWGPFWQILNEAFADAERRRNTAAKRIQNACSADAAKLRAAAQIYTNSDAHLAEQLDIIV